MKTRIILAATLLSSLGCAVSVTAEENAASQYIEAFKAFSSNQEPSDPLEFSPLLPVVGEASMPPPGTPLPHDQLDVVGKYVALNGKCLSLLHQAAAAKECRWPADYRDPSSMPALRLRAEARQGARLLHLEAIYRAEMGDYDLAGQSVRAGLALGRSLSALKETLAELTRMACDELALAGLERALNLGPISDSELAELGRTIGDADASAGVSRNSLPEVAAGPVLGRWHSRLRVAQAAIAVERFRAANGKLPADLTELVPRFLAVVPVDPFDRQSLRYRRTEMGYTVYSVGPDLIDQGGVQTTGGDTDLPFTVERKETVKDAQN